MPTALINNYLKQINDIVDLIKSRHKDNPSFQQELKYLDQQHIHIKIQIEQLKENESPKTFQNLIQQLDELYIDFEMPQILTLMKRIINDVTDQTTQTVLKANWKMRIEHHTKPVTQKRTADFQFLVPKVPENRLKKLKEDDTLNNKVSSNDNNKNTYHEIKSTLQSVEYHSGSDSEISDIANSDDESSPLPPPKIIPPLEAPKQSATAEGEEPSILTIN